VHTDGVAQLLSNIKVNKASGPDNIPAHFLQETALKSCQFLPPFFQVSLEQGVLPSVWKIATVIPIFKKGSRSTIGQYTSN